MLDFLTANYKDFSKLSLRTLKMIQRDAQQKFIYQKINSFHILYQKIINLFRMLHIIPEKGKGFVFLTHSQKR